MRAQNLSWKKTPNQADDIRNPRSTFNSCSTKKSSFRWALHARADDQLVSQILPLRLPQLHKRGRRPLTFPDIFAKDVNLNVEDMRVAMLDRAVWRYHVDVVSMVDGRHRLM